MVSQNFLLYKCLQLSRHLSKPFSCECYISQDKCNWQFFSPEADSIPWVPSSLFHMCTPHLWTFGTFHVRTNKFPAMKISQYYVFAVCDNVAPWNRHQERRRMPGLQGPQPSFLSKIPICECFKELSINIRRQRSNTGLLRNLLGNANLWDSFLGQRNI